MAKCLKSIDSTSTVAGKKGKILKQITIVHSTYCAGPLASADVLCCKHDSVIVNLAAFSIMMTEGQKLFLSLLVLVLLDLKCPLESRR